MKKSKVIKSASLVALSAVMVLGVAMTAAACGNGGGGTNNPGGPGTGTSGTITVSIFCGDADRATNQQIADEWAAAYNEANNTNYTARVDNNSDKSDYFKQLSDVWTTSAGPADIIYLAPRQVKAYARTGRVVDLTQFINEDAEAAENVQKVWQNAISYYGYDTSANLLGYSMGQTISYNTNGATGAGFYTDAGKQVGLYGLPKDYSNFSMGFNRNFFTEELKAAYTSTPVNQTRSIKGAVGADGSKSSTLTYTAATGTIENLDEPTFVATYATDWTDEKGVKHKEGEPANIINIGVPVNYRPFNFYNYATFDDALDAKDPMAVMVQEFTGGAGYTVTIPGFPDETFEINNDKYVDADAVYDSSIGHIVYTYAEYGALQWALTYYLNTFNWEDLSNPTQGTGGKTITGLGKRTIYGGEQYEGVSGGAVGAVLYLLPWLYSNDADLIDETLQFCTSFREADAGTPVEKRAALNSATDATKGINISNRADWWNRVGDVTYTVQKLNLEGELENVAVQYGFNSQRFLETYAAFLAIGSDWNGNPGDTQDVRPDESGWDYFRAGRSLFYGAGSWDSATRNEEDRASFDFGQMPTPVAEKYALYSSVKGANYEIVNYSNVNNAARGTAGSLYGGNATEIAKGLKAYSKDEIIANQIIRQDKWGARMDSVGFAVTCATLSTKKAGGQITAKTKAAASLCIALTVAGDPQVTLTYAGAQLPNWSSQCVDFLNYQKEGYENGAFKDMITPEGTATVKGAEGVALWNSYYDVAKTMASAARSGSSQTVSAFLSGKTDSQGNPIKFDPAFTETKLSEFKGTTTIAFAMKVLRMVALTYSDRDLNIRMQSGLNSVRDASMYTYNDDWLGSVDARGANVDYVLAYNRQRPLSNTNVTADNVIKWNPMGGRGNSPYQTPLVFALSRCNTSQSNLTSAVSQENKDAQS